MESRKSIHIYKKHTENSLHNSPTNLSPLRRKSIAAPKQLINVLSENNDDAERIARRREIQVSSPTTSTSSTNKRYSLGLELLANIPAPQMAESINQCIKLNAENKINTKNAFNLEMIDFMTYMIKKQDDNMSNLQVASTSLDVSTKIYGFRVDGVHMEILKIIGGLDKQVTDVEQNMVEEGETSQEDVTRSLEGQKKKRKKNIKQKIFGTVESLRGNIEISKPMSMMIGEGDLQTSDMLYQATLPNHANSGFYQHLYNDVLVDVVEENHEQKSLQNNNSTKYTVPAIKDFQDLEICASYSNFEFLGWFVENEPEEVPVTEAERESINNGFEFDLDASIEQDDNPMPEPINYFDIENDADNDENINGCYRQSTVNNDENIMDVLIPITATSTTVSFKNVTEREYSFMQPNLHWAGPSHWKFRNLAKPSTGSNIMKACSQAPLRRQKKIELSYDENKDVIEAKFALSRTNRLQTRTANKEWNVESLTLPEDIHYDITQTQKLFLHRNLYIKKFQNNDVVNDAATVDVSDNSQYDYNNPNDTLDYCPHMNNDNYDNCMNDKNRNECDFHFQNGVLEPVNQGFIGDNLVAAPKLANKIHLAYCLKAKKIDMRQLKKSIWNCLKSTNNTYNESIEQGKECVQEPKQFSNIYKMLPKLLTKNNAEALSVPLSFISLLHLANEKVLQIHSLPDMSDIVVKGS